MPLQDADLVAWWWVCSLAWNKADRYEGLRPETLRYTATATLAALLEASVGQPSSRLMAVAEVTVRLCRIMRAA